MKLSSMFSPLIAMNGDETLLASMQTGCLGLDMSRLCCSGQHLETLTRAGAGSWLAILGEGSSSEAFAFEIQDTAMKKNWKVFILTDSACK